MNNLYNKILKTLYIPSESEFEELLTKLPPVGDNFNENGFEWAPYDSLEDLANNILINTVLDKYHYIWLDKIDLDEKTVEINDIEALEDLEEINKIFSDSGWTIINYEKEKEYLENEKKEAREVTEGQELINRIREIASIEQLREIVKDLENDK